ncbi:MAG: hypothetical protein WCC36_03630 [Gammaproteobacteria bacterium]
MIKRPKTPEAYVELVRQALFEVEELRYAVEFDMDSMGGALDFLDELETGVRGLWSAMESGTYQFDDSDLPFMKVIERQSDRMLPFKYLLRQINATHRQGLDVE